MDLMHLTAETGYRTDGISDLACPDGFFLDGCAWGCWYYTGVLRGLLQRWGEQVYQKKVGGSSAGALFALAMALCKSPEYLEHLYDRLAEQGTAYGVFGKMSIYHDSAMKFMLGDDPEAYKKVNGKLFVGLTAFPCRFVLKSQFCSNKDLTDSLHASMHIPWYCTHMQPVRVPERRCSKSGEKRILYNWYVDGGLSKNFGVDICDEGGLTMNMSPVLTWRVGLMDCVFPMMGTRRAESADEARKDILSFQDGTTGSLRREGSSMSLTLSRSGSDISESSLQKMSRPPSLADVARHSADALRGVVPWSSSPLLASGKGSFSVTKLCELPVMKAVRFFTALSLWFNRFLAWCLARPDGKVIFVIMLWRLGSRRGWRARQAKSLVGA